MRLHGSVTWLRIQKLLVWAGLTGLFLMAVALLLALMPVLLAIGVYWHIAERRFLWRLRRSGRFRPWSEIRVHLANRRGTLVLEADRELGQVRRVWWLQEHLLKLFPSAPWINVENMRRSAGDDANRLEPTPANREWCEHYLPHFASAAVLTDVTPALLWSYLDNATCAAPTIAVVPFPVLTFLTKRAT